MVCSFGIKFWEHSLSFAPNPDFTKLFPDQLEILQYIKGVARKFEVDKHIQLNTSWDGSIWQEDTKTWSVRLSNVVTGENFVQECDILISAIGGLVNPNPCTIPGADTFEGTMMHTARWKNDTVLEDKNVVVIGNGCSGSQLVPAIADKVKNVFQFFRSSQFYFPRRNPTISPAVKWAFRYIPGLMVLFRWMVFHMLEYTFTQFHTDERGNRRREYTKKLSDGYVEEAVPKEYWDLLKPTYKVGCKRRVFDPGYLKCLHRDNVHLSSDPIVKIEPKEVITQSGKRYPADIIVCDTRFHKYFVLTPLSQVLANGFATTEFQLNVVGRGGVTPKKHWEDFGGAEAYKTTALSSFPNFFIIFGPNSATGSAFISCVINRLLTIKSSHTSALFSIEITINLVIKLARPIIQGKASEVSVKSEYEREYSASLQEALKDRVWAHCKCVVYFLFKFLAHFRFIGVSIKTKMAGTSSPTLGPLIPCQCPLSYLGRSVLTTFDRWWQARFPDMNAWAYSKLKRD